MQPRTTLRKTLLALLRSLIIAASSMVFLLAPIALGLHLLGGLPLPAALCYGLALPLTLVFGVCLIKFPWDTKVLMIICVGGLFLLSLLTAKHVRLKQLQHSFENPPRSAASTTVP